MKSNKFKKLLITMALSSMCIIGNTATAFAYVDESAATETVAEEVVAEETPVTETETQPESETEAGRVQAEDAFSIPGNAEVVDDITNSSSKEFFTIQTKNNNTFYLVVDRAQTTQNVYMLSAIDENDLEKFLDETQTDLITETESSVVLPETQETEAETSEVEVPKTNQNSNLFLIIGAVILIAGAAGGYYFFKIKPQKEEDDIVSENLEIGDGLETENEDNEDETEDEE